MTYPNAAPAGGPAYTPGQGVPVYGVGGMQPPMDPNQPHPTVGNAGMPGAPVTVLPPNNAPPQHPTLPNNLPPANPPQGTFAAPNAPGYAGPGTPSSFPPQSVDQYGRPIIYGPPAPGPQGGQPVQGWNQPPQGGWGQPPQPPMAQPGGRVNLTDDVILDGPGVPQEFRGRTFGQVKQVYQALATDWIQRNPSAVPGGRPAQGQPTGQPASGYTPPAAAPAGQPTNDDAQFWTNPAAFVRTAVQEAVAPMTAQTFATQIGEARRIATTGVQDYGIIEGEVMAILSQADESIRANPQTWVNAIDMARGRMLRDGRYNQEVQRMRSQPGGQPNGNGQPNGGQPAWGNPNNPPAPNGGPGSAVPATMVPVYGFFTEQPNGPTMPRAGLTPEQQYYAGKFGMSDEQFIAWSSAARHLGQAPNSGQPTWGGQPAWNGGQSGGW